MLIIEKRIYLVKYDVLVMHILSEFHEKFLNTGKALRKIANKFDLTGCVVTQE